METQIHFRGNSAYWNSFKWGTIIPSESTFVLVPRSHKNVFMMFNGLGLNEQLLLMLKELSIKYIEVPFCSDTLTTTTDKWLKSGIPSPYANDRVDKQIILNLDKINLSEDSNLQPSETNNQLTLFGWA